MALLFEKCEQASQTADCPSSDSFDVDIQAFVHHQEQDGKPFFSEDPELDSLVGTTGVTNGNLAVFSGLSHEKTVLHHHPLPYRSKINKFDT